MHWFIVPDLDGPVSGGTLYNRRFIAAANQAGVPCQTLHRAAAHAALARGTVRDVYWVDSLFLGSFAALAGRARPGVRVGLLAHYLPSLLAAGQELGRARLTRAERMALQAASLFLVPSRFMGAVVRRLAGAGPPIICVEPGRPSAGAAPPPDPPMRALLVANLVPGKGVAPFLAALAAHVTVADDFTLRVVGSFGSDPAYARSCAAFAETPRMRGRVELLGELSPEDTLRAMAASNLFISASRMESYGMALAEARALGLPIVARAGGNVANLVEGDAGGQLVSDEAELAVACLGLARDRTRHRQRLAQARTHTLPPRSWADAAREFATQVTAVCARGIPAVLDGERRQHVRGA
jgi:hypothetical protein